MDDFVTTTAVKKLGRMSKRIRDVRGGTSAGKTFTILPLLAEYAISFPNKEISVVSESIPHLRKGALKDFIKIMASLDRWHPQLFNKSLLKYSFPNGSYIEFFSADQPDKLRGARRNVLYINEANNIPFEAYQQLAIRTKDHIWIDYNPTHEFWVDTELKGDEDLESIVLTYKDNEALGGTIVKELEKAREKAKTSDYWANWWNVYGLGLQGSLEGVVFSNWRTIEALPSEARLLGCGLDFGYSNDPTALVGIYKYNDKRILHEILYKKGLVNQEIAPFIPATTVWADSAEPKSIEEIRRLNVDIRAVKKGSDSIAFGIQTMQGQEYLVTETSTNLIKELRNYCYDTDKNGKTLNKPIDNYNHSIDAVRYHEMMTIGIRNEVKVY
ncbi:MAG: terminase large subunit [Bacteroidota bacterium]